MPSPFPLSPSPRQHADLVAAITAQSCETIALLTLVRVCCTLEQRDMNQGTPDGTLADAAEGLAVLILDLERRVAATQEKVEQLAALCPAESAQPVPNVRAREDADVASLIACGERFPGLSPDDRRAVMEILRTSIVAAAGAR